MTSSHVRNTGPMLASQCCGAKTRSGKACMSPRTAAPPDRVLLETTRTRSGMDDLPAKLAQSAA
jgi:hypothetical protein